LEAANPEIKVARQRWEAALAVVVMKRIAAPQVGGVFSAMILTLFVIPPVYVMWRWWREHGENGMSG
jgi:Cu(I)/Ag(I) efflux system membrane protein CusA/SilA